MYRCIDKGPNLVGYSIMTSRKLVDNFVADCEETISKLLGRHPTLVDSTKLQILQLQACRTMPVCREILGAVSKKRYLSLSLSMLANSNNTLTTMTRKRQRRL